MRNLVGGIVALLRDGSKEQETSEESEPDKAAEVTAGLALIAVVIVLLAEEVQPEDKEDDHDNPRKSVEEVRSVVVAARVAHFSFVFSSSEDVLVTGKIFPLLSFCPG